MYPSPITRSARTASKRKASGSTPLGRSQRAIGPWDTGDMSALFATQALPGAHERVVPQATCTAFTGLQGLSREPDLDGGELTFNLSLLAVVARPLIGTPALAAKHGGGLLVGLSPAGPNAIRFGFLLDWSKDRFAAPSLENRMSTVGRTLAANQGNSPPTCRHWS